MYAAPIIYLLDSTAPEHEGHHGVIAQLLLVRKIKPY